MSATDRLVPGPVLDAVAVDGVWTTEPAAFGRFRPCPSCGRVSPGYPLPDPRTGDPGVGMWAASLRWTLLPDGHWVCATCYRERLGYAPDALAAANAAVSLRDALQAQELQHLARQLFGVPRAERC